MLGPEEGGEVLVSSTVSLVNALCTCPDNNSAAEKSEEDATNAITGTRGRKGVGKWY